MIKGRKKRFELIYEGRQIKDELRRRFDGNFIQMFNFLTGENFSSASINQYLRKPTLDPRSKFVKHVELLFEKPYSSIVKTVAMQLEEVINHMSANIELYDEPTDRDAALEICILSESYSLDRRLQLIAEINRLILYGQVGIHDINALEACLNDALKLNHYDLVLRGYSEIIQWNYTSIIDRETASDFLVKREYVTANWPTLYKADFYHLIGQVKLVSGDLKNSSIYLKRSLELYDDPYKMALSALLLADCYIKKLKIGKSRRMLQQILDELDFKSPDVLARVHLGLSKCSQINYQHVQAQHEALTAFWIIEQSDVKDLTRVDVLINCLKACHFTSPDIIVQVIKQLPFILTAHVPVEKVTHIFKSVHIIACKDELMKNMFWETLRSCLDVKYQGEYVTRNKAALFDLYLKNFMEDR